MSGQSQESDLTEATFDHVMFTPICFSSFRTMCSSRHKIADLEAALACIAMKMGQKIRSLSYIDLQNSL